jgi:hypothetical protein
LENNLGGLRLPCINIYIVVKMLEDLKDEITHVKSAQLIETDKGNILLKGWFVQK